MSRYTESSQCAFEPSGVLVENRAMPPLTPKSLKPQDSLIQSILMDLQLSLEVLDKTTTELWQKLNPVVRIEDSKSEPDKASPSTGVPLADILRNKVYQIQDITESQQRLLRAVQL